MKKKSSKKTPNVEQSYLQRLQFVPEMARGVVAAYIGNIRLVLLIIITIILLGTTAYISLPKRLNPEVNIPIVTIATVVPGAGSKDVEQLVTIPLEDSIRSLKGIDVVNSNSQENISVMSIQFVSGIDRDEAKNDVQSAVDSVRLPATAQPPLVRALDFEDQPIWTFALTGDVAYPDLMRTAKQLERHIDELSRVDRVVTTGYDQQEVVIEISPAKLEEYALRADQIGQALSAARGNYPAGQIATQNNTFALTIDPEVETLSDVRNLILSIDGRAVRLGEVATVRERSVPNQPQSLLIHSGESPAPTVTFSVYKTTTSNIDVAGEQVQKAVEEFVGTRPAVEVITISNSSEDIAEQFASLLKEFRSTILLVFITLLLFLGLRQAVIASITVPLTFLSTFFLMQYAGMSLNFLSLFAFLLALGLLVDDTIVIVSAMTSYYRSGKFTPLQTGLLVWRDTIIPIWSTTLTTIWAFVPLLLTSGIIGEFIKPIPIVVTLVMISSTAIAVGVTLPLMVVLLKPQLPPRVLLLFRIVAASLVLATVVALSWGNPLLPLIVLVALSILFLTQRMLPTLLTSGAAVVQKIPYLRDVHTFTDQGVVRIEKIGEAYRRLSLWILEKRSRRLLTLAAVVGYSLFSFALLPLGFVKNEFFPSEGTDTFSVKVELPTGAKIEQSAQQVAPVLEKLSQLPDIDFITAEVGRSGGSNSASDALSNAQNTTFFTLRLVPEEQRTTDSIELAARTRTLFQGYTAAKVSVVESSGGPPIGADVQLTLLGNDLQQLDAYAEKVVSYLESNSAINNVEKSISQSTSKIRFVPDQAKLAQHGVSISTIGYTLRLYASGVTLEELRLDPDSTDETNIVFRMQSTPTSTITGLGQVLVTNSLFQSIPLSELGSFRIETNPTSIARKDFRRTITITAAVDKSQSIVEQNKKLEEFADTLGLPAGYEWQTGGANEENQESVNSIFQAMIVSAVLILLTMVVQFQSFRKALIVIIVIPLAVSSVFLAFALSGTPLSFPALIGVLSLFGIVVTNSMFIVDKINLNLKEGLGFAESLADAGASRLEPIILTKLTTVLGLLPITLSEPLWRGLGGAIIAGLLVASTIMLFFIPSLYYELMGNERTRRSSK